jgi:hypothetical protein
MARRLKPASEFEELPTSNRNANDKTIAAIFIFTLSLSGRREHNTPTTIVAQSGAKWRGEVAAFLIAISQFAEPRIGGGFLSLLCIA